MNPNIAKQEKARNLRYKKAILEEFNRESILDELYNITENCGEIRYIVNGEEATLIDALDGDEEEAYELRMAFSELDSECERLFDLLNEEYICDCFDDFLAGISDGSGMKLIGYDVYEEDYFGLTSYEGKLGCKEAQKRLERMTKSQLISAGCQAFRVLTCFLNVRFKYDYLKAAFDILKGTNTAFLDVIREIEKEYENACDDWHASNQFDALIAGLPDRVWVE